MLVHDNDQTSGTRCSRTAIGAHRRGRSLCVSHHCRCGPAARDRLDIVGVKERQEHVLGSANVNWQSAFLQHLEIRGSHDMRENEGLEDDEEDLGYRKWWLS